MHSPSEGSSHKANDSDIPFFEEGKEGPCRCKIVSGTDSGSRRSNEPSLPTEETSIAENTPTLGEVFDKLNTLSGCVELLSARLKRVIEFSPREEESKSGLAGCYVKHIRDQPTLPDSRFVRRIIRNRRRRDGVFGEGLFSDPAWDILLDLAAAMAERKNVSVTSLCIAAAVPPTTALRWIGILNESGLIERVEDIFDRRRTYVKLSDKGSKMIAQYFDQVEL